MLVLPTLLVVFCIAELILLFLLFGSERRFECGYCDTFLKFVLFYFWLFSSANDSEEDGMAEFRACIKVLADKVCILSRQRAELLDRYSKAEAANRRLTEELEERKELVKALYTKHQLEKQVTSPFGSLMEVFSLCTFCPCR